MRPLTFLTFERVGVPTLGVLGPHDRVVDVVEAAARSGAAERSGASGLSRVLPHDLLGLIREGERTIPIVQDLLVRIDEIARGAEREVCLPLHEARLLAPIPWPTKNVFCVGRNYRDHVAEGYRARSQAVVVPEHPEFFTKPPTAVTGPYADVLWDPTVTEKLDYEVELGVIIGRTGKNIPRDRALDHVFGYTVINDITARDLQRRHGQWFKGKALDGSCPMGPFVVHVSGIPDPQALSLTLRVNGEVRQKASTKDMIFDIPTIIEALSRGTTLDAGDVIATGTPSGVGYARTPPVFLKPGDIIEAEVEGIGMLRNRIELAGHATASGST